MKLSKAIREWNDAVIDGRMAINEPPQRLSKESIAILDETIIRIKKILGTTTTREKGE